MVILCLGSNVGDRLLQLRRAYEAIKQIPQLTVKQVSPVYISDALLPDQAPSHWDRSYLNCALRCETKNTPTPEELLQCVKQIEKNLDRQPEKTWGPRTIDIDILAWDNLIQYDEHLRIPHKWLHERPFALWPLADVAPNWIYPLPGEHHGKKASQMGLQWGSRFSGEAPLHTRQIQQRIDTSQLVGIINVTPDSFSKDGNLDGDLILQLKRLVAEGAEVIDIGAEATNQYATPLTADTEWLRLEPYLPALMSEVRAMDLQPKISIDTRHATTAAKALSCGVDWINDVTGLKEPAMQEIVAAQGCDVVMMHHVSMPASFDKIIPIDQDVNQVVYNWAENQLNQLSKKGIKPEKIILDVGLSFGKNPQQSFSLIKGLDRFKQLGTRLLEVSLEGSVG